MASPFSLSTILLNIANQLSTTLNLPVGLSLSPTPSLNIPSGKYCTVQFGGEVPIEGMTIGVGRFGSVMSARVFINCYVQQALDIAYQDGYKVNNIRNLIQSVTNALMLYFPLNIDGTLMVIEPIRGKHGSTLQQYKKSNEWIYCNLEYEINYVKYTDPTIIA